MILPYLPTKLHRPHLPLNLVGRPELVARLNRGLARGDKLTLVVAPAGFGKTTLVNEWLNDSQFVLYHLGLHAQHHGNSQPPKVKLHCAWLALDDLDNDLARFFQYVVTAVQQIFPSVGGASLRILQAPQLPPATYLATTILSEWATLSEPCLLVLEDYHVITAPAIQQLLAHLLDRLPPQIHLVLVSRTEPPLPLARLRVRQQMTEIRATDLSFSPDETKAFLTQALGHAPTPQTITLLQNQTEGWVAGLQLAALALTGTARSTLPTQSDEARVAQMFAGHQRHVMAYLIEEVLAQQPQIVQRFLLHTALLDRFCAPLAETLLPEEGKEQTPKGEEPIPLFGGNPLAAPTTTGQAILAYLLKANLFIVSLDARGEWYRYHHLFRDLLHHHLCTHLGAAALAILHRRASAWLANHGWIDEAIHHALAGGDERGAANLVAERRHELLNREDWRTLKRRLALLPETLVQQHAGLLIYKVWVLNFQSTMAPWPPLLQAATARLDDPALTTDNRQLIQAEIDALWGVLFCWQNEGQRSVATLQKALETLPASCRYARGGVLTYLAVAGQMIGQSATVVQTLQAVLEVEQMQPNALVNLVLLGLTYIHYFDGKLILMQQTVQTFLQIAMRANLGLGMGWAHYMQGVITYEWNDIETAGRHFMELIDQRYISYSLAIHNGWQQFAWLEQMQGRPDQAQQQVAALLKFHHEQGNLAFLPVMHSFQARLALQQGDLASALRWAQAVNLDPPLGPLIDFELPLLTHAKILLAESSPTSLAQALNDLAQLRQVAEFTHNTIRLIEILAVQALVEAAQGETEPALATLQRSVLLAKPGRCIRTFVDLGPALAGLLYALAKRGIETEYLGELLAAFPASLQTLDPAQQVRRTAQAQLIEPLTERESEVLLHLQHDLPNKVIARKLNISALTVKKHTVSLYQKLSVQSRQQAVARARALGILPAMPT